MLERAWLAKTPFLGSARISTADLQVCAELEQFKLLYGLDLVRLLLCKRHGTTASMLPLSYILHRFAGLHRVV